MNQNPLKTCPSAISQYKEKVIDKYLAKYKAILEKYRENDGNGNVASISNLSTEEAYILIELAHWVINRDKRRDLAIDLYDIVLAHYTGSKKLVEYNALVSRGSVWNDYGSSTLAIKDFKSVI
ncbi:MAG: hypothetical protein AAGE84_16295 [Cyanobacteria bacterium P01_G01_bin.39]